MIHRSSLNLVCLSDNKSEQHVKTALHNTRKDRTTIIIAHRLTTIKDADLILVFDKGQIAEQGTDEELREIPDGIYRKLAAEPETNDEHEEESEQESEETIVLERQRSVRSSCK